MRSAFHGLSMIAFGGLALFMGIHLLLEFQIYTGMLFASAPDPDHPGQTKGVSVSTQQLLLTSGITFASTFLTFYHRSQLIKHDRARINP